ncbi:MAG: flippase activity-associated protein Agl23 [Anaerolineae bacterium]
MAEEVRDVETAPMAAIAESPVPSDPSLDRPVAGLLRGITLEQGLYLLLIAVAIISRFWDLGARAMSHDESLHTLFSWKLYAGEGYVHDPMMHGPFKFHANALVYFLFGVSDFTSRIVPALFGVALVGLPYCFRRYIGRAGALVASALILISPSLLYYSRYIRDDIYMVTWAVLLALTMFEFLRTRHQKWLLFGAIVVGLAIATMENALIVGFIGLTFILVALLWERLDDRGRLWMQAILAGVIALMGIAVVVLHLAFGTAAEGQVPLAAKVAPNLVFVALLAASALAASALFPSDRKSFSEAVAGIGWAQLRWPLIAFGIIFVLLFTTFFTNLKGLYTGSLGAVIYWLEQQDVQRGGQPWYYYIFLMPFYDLVPYFIGISAIGYYVYRGARRRLGEAGEAGNGYWLAYLVYWSCATFVIYSWAGEKMPWLVVHPVIPLLLLAATAIGRWLQGQDWRGWLQQSGLALCGIIAIGVLAVAIILRTPAFRGMSLAQLQDTGRWIGAAVTLLLCAFGTWTYYGRVGGRGVASAAKATALALVTVLTLRFGYMASFVNYDYVNEFLVYAHGTPDLKLVLGQMEEISRRTAGFRELQFAYDQDDTWPLEWYFKDWPNRIFYGNEPNKTAMEAPVVLVNGDNEAKAAPFLGDRYYRFKYRLVWWPIEDYKGLTPGKIFDVLRDPARLDKWLTIWFYRRYETPFSEWPFKDEFYLYISKDLLNQMWDMGVTLALPQEAPADPYQAVWQDKAPGLTLGGPGVGEGQFTNPRAVAVAGNGDVYVADSGSSRIEVFDALGQFKFAWGSAGSGLGQFQEPWGLAIAANGDVYVADTWNHRVQVFDAAGTYKTSFGFFADAHTDAQASPGGFWGPRGIVLDAEGNVYVTDTGNKRVQAFTADGEFIAAYGGEGTGAGQFSEPVGIARDEEGNFYVADAWNHRVQVFDAQFTYVSEWPVDSWQGESLVNKPYLAADNQYVYASDPEGYRILVYDKQGNIVQTFGRFGQGEGAMDLPTGLTLDEQGRLWVTDTQNSRLLRFDMPRP